MRKLLVMSLLFGFFSHNCQAFAAEQSRFFSGQVTDEKMAISIASDVWESVYGKKHIEKQKPYVAVLKKHIWYVSGSLPAGSKGGVAVAEIDKNDGRIVRVGHTK